MNELHIEYLPPPQINPYAGNARLHSPAQIQQIVKSVDQFGFINPVLIDSNNQLIAGHGRLMAAIQLGLAKIPAIRVEHLSEPQRRAFALADNKIALNAEWENGLLKVELEYLMKADVDFGVDLTGFSVPEINLLLTPSEPDTAEELPLPEPPAPAATVTQLGDVWQLGPHRIICGDSREPGVMNTLMQGKKARLVVEDPPFNVKINGHVSGLGKTKHEEFQMASGEMTVTEFTTFLEQAIGSAQQHSVDGALLYFFIDWRHLPELQTACAALTLTPMNLCVWVKSNGGMGTFYRSQHELIYVVKNGKAAHLNHFNLGQHGRYRSNVWQYAGMNAFGKDRDELLAQHPTVKPIAMIQDVILDVTNPHDLVFDGFLGSGTTLLAAAQCHRHCYGVEIAPRYVDVCLLRWMAMTGQQPIHLETGQTFKALRDVRMAATMETAS